MRPGDTLIASRQRMRDSAGKGAYRRFAEAMAEFREAIAEMVEMSKPDPNHNGGSNGREVRAKLHSKVITKLRANGYRPLSDLREDA